jgi:hypothetical protein
MGKHKKKHHKHKVKTTPRQIQQPPVAPSQSLIRKVPKAVWWVIGALAVIVTLLEGYPWLSIQEGVLLNPSNPYSELFSISNAGYIPVTDLDASCVVNFQSPHSSMTNSGATFRGFAQYIGHGKTATIPCFMTVSAWQVPSGARFDVYISYAFYHLNFDRLRRHQVFQFQCILGNDGAPHWIFLAP